MSDNFYGDRSSRRIRHLKLVQPSMLAGRVDTEFDDLREEHFEKSIPGRNHDGPISTSAFFRIIWEEFSAAFAEGVRFYFSPVYGLWLGLHALNYSAKGDVAASQ